MTTLVARQERPAMPTSTCAWEFWDLDEALAVLEHRKLPNRSRRQDRMKRYARDMSAGRWDPEAGAIVILSEDGELLNGQHTLGAIVESGVAQWVLTLRGAHRGALALMDSGAPRNIRDALTIQGETSASALGAALRALWQARRDFPIGDRSAAATPTISDHLTMLAAEPGIREYLTAGRKLSESTGFHSTGAAICLTYLFHEADDDAATQFLTAVIDGLGRSETDPVVVLRKTLEKSAQPRSGAARGADPSFRAAVTIKAFNDWRLGREIGRLYTWRTGQSARRSRLERFPHILTREEIEQGER